MPWCSTIRSDIQEWWIRRERFEKVMMFAILGALIVLIALLSTKDTTPLPLPRTCQTPICLEEAAKITQSIHTNTRPCSNIFTFSCGNCWTDGDPEQLTTLAALKTQQFNEIANEPVHKEEHRLVKLAKKIYQGCLDDYEIERDRLTTFKQVLKAVGGWPMVEGDNWNEDKFNWMNVTYKVREMGYYYGLYLVVRLRHDNNNSDKYILQVSTADVFNYQYGYTHIPYNVHDIMITIAQIFGAQDRNKTEEEVDQVMKFWNKMNKIQHPDYYKDKHFKFTVETYQIKVGAIDWLTFINKIIAPTAEITKNDSVLFVPPEDMTDWLDLLGKTPKRVQANYMIWKLVSETIPFLNCELRVGNTGLKKKDTRENICMGETSWRFIINPLRIMAARRNLPAQRRKKAEELLVNIKSELISVMTKVEWMEEEDKAMALETVKQLSFWIGLPFDYLDDKILDDFSLDLVENKYNDSFVSLVAQGMRNHESMIFKQLDISKSESYYEDGYDSLSAPDYFKELNTLYLSDVSVQKFFNEERPNYLNYGALGSLVGYQFARVVTSLNAEWSEKTKEAFLGKIKCIEQEMDEFLKKIGTIKWDSSQTLFLTQKAVGQQLSFAAYSNWLKKNGQELPLIAVDYTPNQLFWISSAMAWCGPNFPPNSADVLDQDSEFLIKLLGVSIGNEQHFASNFNCKNGAIMNPNTKCKIF